MAHDRLGELHDDAVPGLAALVSSGLPEPVRAAVEAAGGKLVSASPGQITYRPGRSVTVRFDAKVAWPGRGAVDEALVARTGGTLPPGAVVVDDGDTSVAVWRLPLDPALPGLASALECLTVRALLDDLGLAEGAVEVCLRAYRPLRRAVVEAVTPEPGSSSRSSPRRRSAVERYAARLLAGFDATVEPGRLRREVAAVVLGLATGPFRVQQPGWADETGRRVALAEQWLESATP